ncbi:hypothetical protein O3W44_18970 [Pantoea sp. LMR881]|uniref:hypothetical protein n=1 Tax=Pantoea sp. LMR881 TaxID=3014336 RepID=UPI0022AFAA5E|nr:hypothetical protein [Pantoea sp. LMR881]MCZ4060728.1 hypothetical protein [Pantoea sp. LMR881]
MVRIDREAKRGTYCTGSPLLVPLSGVSLAAINQGVKSLFDSTHDVLKGISPCSLAATEKTGAKDNEQQVQCLIRWVYFLLDAYTAAYSPLSINN